MSIQRIALGPGADLPGFRQAVRRVAAAAIPPDTVVWTTDAPDLFGETEAGHAPPIALPRGLADLIDTVVCHQDPQRYAFLYQAVWRVLHGEPKLLEVASDPLVFRLERMRKSVNRDIHKMHAFLRFRLIGTVDDTERYVAWFEPEHFILHATSDFFVTRFRSLVWSILTPIGSLHWDRESLTHGPPATRADSPDRDPFEQGWTDYYTSTFNPARVNPKLMRSEMPLKYWRNMPETQSIRKLVQEADVRAREMITRDAIKPRKRDPRKAVAAMLRRSPT